jgi:hypothetical protein
LAAAARNHCHRHRGCFPALLPSSVLPGKDEHEVNMKFICAQSVEVQDGNVERVETNKMATVLQLVCW